MQELFFIKMNPNPVEWTPGDAALPMETEVTGSVKTAILSFFLGGGCLAITTFIFHNFARSPREAALRGITLPTLTVWILPFFLFGILAILSGIYRVTTRHVVRLEAAGVTIERRGLFGRLARTFPYSDYEGIVRRVALLMLPGNREPTPFFEVWLALLDEHRNRPPMGIRERLREGIVRQEILLYRGIGDERYRTQTTKWRHFSRLLNLPMLEEENPEVAAEDIEEDSP